MISSPPEPGIAVSTAGSRSARAPPAQQRQARAPPAPPPTATAAMRSSLMLDRRAAARGEGLPRRARDLQGGVPAVPEREDPDQHRHHARSCSAATPTPRTRTSATSTPPDADPARARRGRRRARRARPAGRQLAITVDATTTPRSRSPTMVPAEQAQLWRVTPRPDHRPRAPRWLPAGRRRTVGAGEKPVDLVALSPIRQAPTSSA